jgi:hypothetical protein
VAYLHATLPDSLSKGLPTTEDRWSGFATADRLLTADGWEDINHIVADRTRDLGHLADELTAQMSARDADETLYYVHFPLPHGPWRYLPSGREYATPERIRGIEGSEDWVEEPWLVEQEYQRHLLQVGYTDRILGQVLDRLERTGIGERALVVVVGDHGIGFEPGERRRPVSRGNIADIARVPLFVRLPGQTTGRVDRRPVSTIDILPTIADVLDMHLPAQVEGRSLLGRISRPTVRVLSRSGDVVEFPSAEVDRDQAATLRRKQAAFGEGNDSLFDIGTHTHLLGRSLSALRVSTNRSVRVDLEDEGLLADVQIPSPFVPARIAGAIDGVAVEPDTELAVAVNGTIVALTRCSRIDGEQQFEALVPEHSLRRGRNRVEVLAIEDTGAGVRLTRLGGASR